MPASISDGIQEQQVHSTCFLALPGVVRRQVINRRTNFGENESLSNLSQSAEKWYWVMYLGDPGNGSTGRVK